MFVCIYICLRVCESTRASVVFGRVGQSVARLFASAFLGHATILQHIFTHSAHSENTHLYTPYANRRAKDGESERQEQEP